MKECRDIVRELIAMMECGAFEIDAFKNDFDTYDYIASYSSLMYDGMVFRLDGELLDIELTSKENKALNKALAKRIDQHIINEGSWDGFKAIEEYLGY